MEDLAGTKTQTLEGEPLAAQTQRGPGLRLAFPIDGDFRETELDGGDRWVVGRTWLRERFGLHDRKASNRQFVLERHAQGWQLHDLGAKNRTHVNGRAVETATLADGDLVRAGSSLLVFRQHLPPLETEAQSVSSSAADSAVAGVFWLNAVEVEITRIASLGRRDDRPVTVLIEGETGAGKEMVAMLAAARLLGVAPTPEALVAINGARLVESLADAELFGHAAGSFTGATKARGGSVRQTSSERALFLDEIGEVPLAAQPKLLRLLQNSEVHPVGADEPLRLPDLVVIAATNRHLADAVRDGTFRQDLFQRIAATVLTVPPLRAHVEDLYEVLLELARRRDVHVGSHASPLHVTVAERLMLHPWPGNVRELDNVLARCSAGGCFNPTLAQLEDLAAACELETVETTAHASGARRLSIDERAERDAAIRRCLGAGMSWRAIEDELGVSRGAVARVAKG